MVAGEKKTRCQAPKPAHPRRLFPMNRVSLENMEKMEHFHGTFFKKPLTSPKTACILETAE